MKKLTTEKMVSFFIFISAEGGRQSRDGNCFALIKKPAGGDRADGEIGQMGRSGRWGEGGDGEIWLRGDRADGQMGRRKKMRGKIE